TACSATNANCSVSVVNNVCTYTTSCKTGYGNIQNSGKYNPSCSANTYTVTLSAPDATTAGTTSVTATYNATMPTATMPEKTGSNFMGYFDATTGGTQYYTASGTSARTWNKTINTTLYAQWSTCAACSPTHADCSVSIVDNVCTYTTTCEPGYGNIVGNGTATPSCTPNTYNVILNKVGGTSGTDSVTATYDSPMPSATMPTRDGNIFKGYFDMPTAGNQYYTATGESAQNWDKTPDGDANLYARWSACQTCSVDSSAECNLSIVNNTCTYTTTCKTGYGNIDGDGTATPSCTPNTYNITLSAPDATTPGTASVIATFNSPMPHAIMPLRTNHIFKGYWDELSGGLQYYNTTGGSVRTWTLIEDTTLHARWTECTPCDAGNGAECELSVVNNTCTYTTSCKTGYGGIKNIGKYNPYCVPNTYTVTLSAPGATMSGTTSVTATYDSPMPAATMPKWSNRSFIGYFDATTDGTQYYNADGTSANIWDKIEDSTLHAQWMDCPPCDARPGANCSMSVVNNTCTYKTSCEVGYGNIVGNGTATPSCTPNTYTVTLSAPDATIPGTTSVTATYDLSMPTVITPQRDYYTFVGYFDAESGGTQYYNADGTSAREWDQLADTNLYAQWSQCTPCDATNAFCTNIVEDNICTYVTSCKTGYGNIQNDGEYNPSCTPNTYTVTLSAPGATTQGTASVTVIFGSPMPTATMPQRTGWDFVGFFDAITGGTQYYNSDGTSTRTWDVTGNKTLYAQWSQNSVTCPAGQYLKKDATTCTTCTSGNYCSGGTFNLGVASDQGITSCPSGTSGSDGNRDDITTCFFTCPPKSIANGTATAVNATVHYNGTDFPTCTYSAVCDTDYTPINSPSADPKCKFNGTCPAGYYCPGDANEPIVCPAGGTSEAGTATAITDCYIVQPHPNFSYGTANQTCYYNTDNSTYNRCIKFDVLTCDAGYYWDSGQACTVALDGYFSPALDINQTQCPTGANGSDLPRNKDQNCYKTCTINVANSTSVTPANDKVYYNTGTYPACSFDVNCKTGYNVQDNNTATPSCAARQYTVTLDKNGGSGSVATSVTCTFDSGACTLPETSGINRVGYTTTGKWCTGKTGGTCYTGGNVSTNISATGSNITLYAQWDANTYKIDLDHQSATVAGAPGTVYLKYDTGWYSDANAETTITKLSTTPSKTGYELIGYFTQTNGNGTQIIDSSSNFINTSAALGMTSVSPTTIYASWSADVYPCAAGQYYNGTTCTTCTANNYCPGGNFATDGGVQGLNACPDNGKSPVGSTHDGMCYKIGLTYTAGHGTGTQTCMYNGSTYTDSCYDKLINACDAGYYYTSGIDCVVVGDGYFSATGETSRSQCPDNGITGTDSANNIQACYKTGLNYSASYGSGTMTCFYSSGIGASAIYNTNCHDKHIDRCAAGYWRATTTDEDCSAVGRNYFSVNDIITRTKCPDNGVTSVENATGAGQCYKDGEPYTAVHGYGTQTCFYDENISTYTVCQDITITYCDGGYYRTSGTATDCNEVGTGYFSPASDLGRFRCESNGLTLTTTSDNISQCYLNELNCPITNGTGEQTCNYTSGNDTSGTTLYNTNCTTCTVTSCLPGFSEHNNTCTGCEENHYCTDGNQFSCATVGDGSFIYSDAGTMTSSMCYKQCSLVANANEMRGRDYYSATDTCEIVTCDTGYYLNNDTCTVCPAGSYCDGTTVNNGRQMCANLGDGTWTESDPASSLQSECFVECNDYSLTNGTAFANNPIEFYPNKCSYYCVSNGGSTGEIIGNSCTESQCKADHYMLNGTCVLCNIENALSYKPGFNCEVQTCAAGYHPMGQSCVENIKECSAPYADEAYRTWNNKTNNWGTCVIKTCEYGYHVSSNACVPDEQTCIIENGRGYREWDSTKKQWGECVVEYCNPGYSFDKSETNEHSKPCGQCKNKFSVLGELAASSYVTGCEIATCMYQGELYNLEGNECVPICDVNGRSDETGTMKWNPSTKKCERKCNDGFTAW
ncbi:InlB B-repeat-containing protein, partial [Lachnospiraceae bacterium OttesenSCG-928-E19]|nr:InlB B-repeat-containing protein [Lachnospiraceae bacterium OttesenSCG-928-E19]